MEWKDGNQPVLVSVGLLRLLRPVMRGERILRSSEYHGKGPLKAQEYWSDSIFPYYSRPRTQHQPRSDRQFILSPPPKSLAIPL